LELAGDAKKWKKKRSDHPSIQLIKKNKCNRLSLLVLPGGDLKGGRTSTKKQKSLKRTTRKWKNKSKA